MSISSATKQFDDALVDAENGKAQAEADVLRYGDQITKLKTVIATVKATFSAADIGASDAKKSVRVRTAKPAKPHKVSMPDTDKAFWMGLLTDAPQKTGALFKTACEKLSIEEADAERAPLLKGRLTTFLQTSSNDHSIKSQGERANRTYSLN